MPKDYLDFEDIPIVKEKIAKGLYHVRDTLVFRDTIADVNVSCKVIGVNAESRFLPPHITVMLEPLSRGAFDEGGNNHWETCSLRRFLNEDFPHAMPVLSELAHEVYKKNNDGQGDTLDRFWLLSLSELDDELSPYKEFVSDIRNLQSDADYRWLRSAYRGSASLTWFVNSSGHVYHTSASYAYRFSPVCVLW